MSETWVCELNCDEGIFLWEMENVLTITHLLLVVKYLRLDLSEPGWLLRDHYKGTPQSVGLFFQACPAKKETQTGAWCSSADKKLLSQMHW